jgi:radical SAM-linked protein
VRVRIRFAKVGKVRFTSHRDVARMWERALRRARLSVAQTEGFRPRPKLSFGLARSTGHESTAEYLDVELAEPLDDAGVLELPGRLSPELPVGIDVVATTPLEPGSLSLQEAVRSCTWSIEALDLAVEPARALVDRALAAETLIVARQRKGREVVDDLRPAVLSVSVIGPTPSGTELEAELAVHPRSVRPAELLAALDPALAEGRVRRVAQWTRLDGARGEPLPVAAGLYLSSHSPTEASTTRRDPPDDRARSRGAGVELVLDR